MGGPCARPALRSRGGLLRRRSRGVTSDNYLNVRKHLVHSNISGKMHVQNPPRIVVLITSTAVSNFRHKIRERCDHRFSCARPHFGCLRWRHRAGAGAAHRPAGPRSRRAARLAGALQSALREEGPWAWLGAAAHCAGVRWAGVVVVEGSWTAGRGRIGYYMFIIVFQ